MNPASAALRRRTAQHFSKPESFGLFMEALRDLQLYAEESSKAEPSSDQLNQLLDDALESLESCHRQYPFDLLPDYYLAITLTMQNQRLYAEEVQKGVSQPEAHQDLLASRPWPLLDRAATLLNDVITSRCSELTQAAQFNLAHVLAKRDGDGDLKHALTLLTPLPEHPARPGPSTYSTNLWGWVRGKKGEQEEASYRAYQESVALFFQAETLKLAIEARISLADGDMFAFKKSLDHLKEVRDTIASTADEDLDPLQTHDLLADSWTKSGFLYHLRAMKGEPPRRHAEDLQAAEDCLQRALQFKPFWTPAQTYLAMVSQAQGDMKKATEHLYSILGKPATSGSETATIPPGPAAESGSKTG